MSKKKVYPHIGKYRIIAEYGDYLLLRHPNLQRTILRRAGDGATLYSVIHGDHGEKGKPRWAGESEKGIDYLTVWYSRPYVYVIWKALMDDGRNSNV
jgi:hypothetical protein